jgi:hypothetical protein
LQLSDNGTTNGTLEVAGKLWSCGNTELSAYAHSLGDNPTTWPILQVDTGGELDLDNNQNASVAYRTISANNHGWSKIYAGVSTDACTFATGSCPTTIKGVNLGASNPDLFEDTTSDSIIYRIYGTKISDCGSASKGCIGDSYWYGYQWENAKNYADYGVIDIQNSLFLRTGTLQSASGMTYDIMRPNLVNNQFRNDLAGVQSLDGPGTYSGSSCNYSGNYFSLAFGTANENLVGCSITGNAFPAGTGYAGSFPAFSGNFIATSYSDGVAGYTALIQNNYIVSTSTSGSAHFYLISVGGTGVNYRLQNNVAESLDSAMDEGHIGAVVGAASSSYTGIVLGNLSVISANGYNSGTFSGYDVSGAAASVEPTYLDHNGGNGITLQGWVTWVGHGGSYYPTNTIFPAVRSNLGYIASAGSGNYMVGDLDQAVGGPGNAPATLYNAANVDYNNTWHGNASSVVRPK